MEQTILNEISGRDIAIAMFLVSALITLAITFWAARRTSSTSGFLIADGQITAGQNAMAMAGDYISAASLLGVSGALFLYGFDAVIYILSPLIGLTVALFLVAEKIRNLGPYTFVDIIAVRFPSRSLRLLAALSSFIVCQLFLVAQMVGAGALVEILFEVDYVLAITMVGLLMMIYVAIGGMLATTWIQITKAVVLIIAVPVLALLTLAHFDYDYAEMLIAAQRLHTLGENIIKPGGMVATPFDAVSLAFALVLGLVGLPHVLMRFYTVPTARDARRSLFMCILIVAAIFILIYFVIGVGGAAIVSTNQDVFQEDGSLLGGSNMVSMHLAAMVGGAVFFGFMCAVTLLTILAVVAGLTLAATAAISHDIYHGVFEGKILSEVVVLRGTTVLVGVLTVLLAIAFHHQNISYMVALVTTIAASANFPVLMLSLFWRGLTNRGAVIGVLVGLISSVLMVALGPTTWVVILGNPEPVFPYPFPAIFSMSLSFIFAYLFSKTDRSCDLDQLSLEFERMQYRASYGRDKELK